MNRFLAQTDLQGQGRCNPRTGRRAKNKQHRPMQQQRQEQRRRQMKRSRGSPCLYCQKACVQQWQPIQPDGHDFVRHPDE